MIWNADDEVDAVYNGCAATKNNAENGKVKASQRFLDKSKALGGISEPDTKSSP